MKSWEIIADNLKKRGWSLGYVSAIDSNGRTIWVADAHRGDGKRFVVRADEKLTAFLELESAIRPLGRTASEISHRRAGSAATEATSLPSAFRTAVNVSSSTTSLLSSM